MFLQQTKEQLIAQVPLQGGQTNLWQKRKVVHRLAIQMGKIQIKTWILICQCRCLQLDKAIVIPPLRSENQSWRPTVTHQYQLTWCNHCHVSLAITKNNGRLKFCPLEFCTLIMTDTTKYCNLPSLNV